MAYPGASTYPGRYTYPGTSGPDVVVDAVGDAPTLDRLMRGGRRLRWRWTILSAGAPVLDEAGEPVAPPVVSASITAADATPTRQLRAEIAPGHRREWVPDGSPDSPGRWLHPDSRAELQAVAGILEPRWGIEVWWTLMVADLGAGVVDLGDEGSGVSVALDAPDRCRRVATSLMIDAVKAEAESPREALLAQMVTAAASGVPVQPVGLGGFAGLGLTIGRPGADPIEAAQAALGDPAGLLVRCSPEGAIRLEPTRDPATDTPDWTWSVPEGDPIWRMSTQLRGSVGAVLVPWQAPPGDDGGQSPSGVVAVPDEHTRPRSWWEGDASTLPTPDAARAAGRVWLLREQAKAERPSLRVLLDPRVQVGQIAHITNPRLGLDQAARITGITYDIAGDSMDLTLAGRLLREDLR